MRRNRNSVRATLQRGCGCRRLIRLRHATLAAWLLLLPAVPQAVLSQTVPAAASAGTYYDTPLDIDHAEITASLVGCNPRKNDLVLVNGKLPDHELWEFHKIVPADSAPSHMPQVFFRIKPGYYQHMTLSVGRCSFGPFPLATADTYGDRHLLLTEARGTAASDSAGVYGFMPLQRLKVVLRGDGPADVLVAKDEVVPGDMREMYRFYFDAVRPGRYVLTVYGDGWQKSLGTVVVDKAGQLISRDIASGELAPYLTRPI